MAYPYEQLVAWYRSFGWPLPRGTSSFGVAEARGVLELVVLPDHDRDAVASFVRQFPDDAIEVRISDERWYAYRPPVADDEP